MENSSGLSILSEPDFNDAVQDFAVKMVRFPLFFLYPLSSALHSRRGTPGRHRACAFPFATDMRNATRGVLSQWMPELFDSLKGPPGASALMCCSFLEYKLL